MPIFGSTKPHNSLSKGPHHERPQDFDNSNTLGQGQSGMMQSGNETYPTQSFAPQTGVGAGVCGFTHPNQFQGSTQQPQQGFGPGHTGAGFGHDNMADGGAGAIPPTSAMNAGAGEKQFGAGHAMTGKIEYAAGTMLGSKSLKAKGLQKEQEAKAVHVQAQELAEAERLEREAMMRRERAVAHGAHPANRNLGGGDFSQA